MYTPLHSHGNNILLAGCCTIDILSHYTTTLLLRNCICPFSPTSQFFVVTWQFFTQACVFTCVMLTWQYLLWSSCSVQSLVVPTGRMVILSTLIQKAYDNIFFECFVALDHFRYFFKTDILPTCDIFDHLKDRLVSQARQFQFPWQCWSQTWILEAIGTLEQKRSSLWDKPTFYKQKLKLPPQASLNWRYKGHWVMQINFK